MKKVCLLVMCLLLLPLVAAHEESAGLGPGSFLWSVDLFFENLNVWLTFDAAEKVRIHLAHAAERVEEAEDASDKAMEKLIARREKDLIRAKEAFDAYEPTDKAHELALASDAQASLNAQREQLEDFLKVNPDPAQLMLDQNDEWDKLLEDYELPAEELQDSTNLITGAVVAEPTDDITLPSKVTPSESGEESEGQVNAAEPVEDDGISIVARTQGNEITRVNVTIGDVTKGFVLSVTDQNATLKEIMKRFNLSQQVVIDNMDWQEG